MATPENPLFATAAQLIEAAEDFLATAKLDSGTVLTVVDHHSEREVYVLVDGRAFGTEDYAGFPAVLHWAHQRFGASTLDSSEDARYMLFWVVKPSVTRGMTLSVTGLTWAQVSFALDWSSVAPELWAEFMAEHRLVGPVCFMATHSAGSREFTMARDRSLSEVPYLSDPQFSGGWHCFREGDVTHLFASSANSGSSLTATLAPDDTWSLELWVPLRDDDTPYKGSYWETFHQVVLGVEPATVPV
jgi:hypothetical protein